MHRFKPPWSTFNSLRKMSGSNTLARSPSASGPFRRCSHETKTSSPPHTPADEVLPANGGIGDDFAGGCIGYLLSRNVRLFLTDLGAHYPRFADSINCAAILTSSVGWPPCDRTTRHWPRPHA